jgi:hypothetical protein
MKNENQNYLNNLKTKIRIENYLNNFIHATKKARRKPCPYVMQFRKVCRYSRQTFSKRYETLFLRHYKS